MRARQLPQRHRHRHRLRLPTASRLCHPRMEAAARWAAKQAMVSSCILFPSFLLLSNSLKRIPLFPHPRSEEGVDELDELEDDSPPPGSSDVGSRSPSVSTTVGGGSAKKKSAAAKVASSGTSTPRKPSTSAGGGGSGSGGGNRSYSGNLTLEEIEALPAAKRRKTLKARGAQGPGRGWRKGLKM